MEDHPLYISLYKSRQDIQLTDILLTDIRYNPHNISAIYYLGRLLIDPKYKYYNNTQGHQLLTYLSDNYNHPHATCILAARATTMSNKLFLYKKAAYNNSKFAMTWLGRYNLTANPERGVRWLERAASYNYLDALNELGRYYKRMGRYERSFYYYNISKELGNIIGIKNIGKFYRDGKYVSKNIQLSEELLTNYWLATKEYISYI